MLLLPITLYVITTKGQGGLVEQEQYLNNYILNTISYAVFNCITYCHHKKWGRSPILKT